MRDDGQGARQGAGWLNISRPRHVDLAKDSTMLHGGLVDLSGRRQMRSRKTTHQLLMQRKKWPKVNSLLDPLNLEVCGEEQRLHTNGNYEVPLDRFE